MRAGFSCLFIVLVIAGCAGERSENPDSPAAPEPPAASRDAPEVVIPDPDTAYVGREACAGCHQEIYRTYAGTGMGRSFYPLGSDNVVEDFSGDVEIVGPAGERYRVYERDGRYWQRQYVLDSAGREMNALEQEMTLVIGSNNHARAYVSLVEGRMFQMPVCWYPWESRWEMCPGFEHKNDHFSREVGSTCVFCHNGVMRLADGERNLYREPVPHGIGCERCHGPGAAHVRRWSEGESHPDAPHDRTIVNPRHLPLPERQHVCFQCHLGDARATERVALHDRDLESYRPGEPVTSVMMPFRYVEQTQHDFGLSAQADRMILSRCFTESDGQLECLSCHDPHVSIYREDRPADYFRQKCLACHQVEECSGPEHDGDCVACHMRRAEPDDQRFAEFTDHWIRRDAIAVQPDRRESFEIEAIYPERYLVLPPGEQAYYRARAYFLLANDAPSNRRQEMWRKAEEAFREALRQGFDEADAWFFLAKTWLALGQGPRAVEALREAVARAPDHHDATFALGQALAAMGRGDESEKQFRHMLENDPRDVTALAEVGRLSWSRKRYEDALAAYRAAVKREPLDATLHLDLGMVLASMGRFDEAAEAGVAATRLDPASVGNWEFYTNVMRAAGRPDAEREGQRQVERLRSGR